MKTKIFSIQLIVVLVIFFIKGFAQVVPHDWPIIDSELTHRMDSTQMLVNAKWLGKNYCTQFAGSLTLASTNRGYSLWTPHPPGLPGVVDVAWQNTLLGQIDTELMMMDTLGYKAIDMDIEYPTLIDTFPNSQLYMSFEKKVFAMAHSMGFKTIVNCHTFIPPEHYALRDLDSFYYFSGGKADTMNTQTYLASKLQMMQTVIDSLAPDYLTLLEEPQAEYANLYGLVPFPADSSKNYVNYWLSHLDKKNALLGAGAGTWDVLKFFEDFASTNIDYMDYHVYPIAGTCLKPMVLQVDSVAEANSKPLVIGECWAHKCTDSDWAANPSIGYWKDTFFIGDDFDYFEHLDTLFVQTMIDVSQQANIGLVDFWNTQNEFGYLTYGPSYYGMKAQAIEDLKDSINYSNMYKEQLGPLGVFTKKAVGKINALCASGCTLGVTANVISNVSCIEGSNGSALAIPSGGTSPYTYLWYGGVDNATNTGLSAGTYTITTTDYYGCTASASTVITQPNILDVSANAIANVSCNGGNDGAASSNVSGGTSPYTYAWNDGASQTTVPATGLSAGTYKVIVTDNCNNSATAFAIITQPIALGITMASSTNSGGCTANGNATANAATGGTSPYTYLWSPTGGTNLAIAGLSGGTYTVIVTDINSCTATATAVITQPAGSIAITMANATNVDCYGNSTGSATANTATGGTSPYSYAWSPGGETTLSISGLSAGSYIITATDSYNCSASAPAVITQPMVLQATTYVLDSTGGNSIAAVAPSGGTSPYTYAWSPITATTDTIKSLLAGLYTCTITDDNSCSTSASVTIVPTGINEVKGDPDSYRDEKVKVYPNPNNGKFEIQIVNGKLLMLNGEIQVYNILGQQVYSQLTIDNSQFIIDLSSQPAGIYLYRVISEDGGLVGEGKLVIQK